MITDRTGQHIDNYRLLQKLGGKNFGQVYLAEDLRRKTKVAIKILDPFATQKERDQFFDEVRSLVRLRHPHIVSVIDFGIDKVSNLPFIVMEYAPNGSLRQRHDGQQIPLATVVQYVKQIASALQYAHDDQLVHCDVKPDSIFIAENGEVLLGNFDIAVTSRTRYVLLQKAQRKTIGTPQYMAPEQIKYRPSFSSDQYALAIIAYEWLCGKPPFTGSYIEIFEQHLHTSPKNICGIVPTIPPQVEQVVQKAIAKEVKDRYPTIQAFADALEVASKSILSATLLFNYRGHSDAPCAFAWSPDGSCFAIGGISGLIQIWDASAGNLLRTCEDVSTSTIHVLAWSPDGSRLASISDGSCFTSSSDDFLFDSFLWNQTVQVWDTLSGQVLLTYSGHSENVNMVAWSSNSSRIASCSNDHTVQIWDACTGQQIVTYNSHSSPVLAVAWSPNGSLIASGFSDGTVEVWNPLDTLHHSLVTCNGHFGAVNTVAWSPDGLCIASGSTDHTVKIWDATGGQLLLNYIGHSGRVNIVVWSPDGLFIASGSSDHTVQIWDTSKKEHLLTPDYNDKFDYWDGKTMNVPLLVYAGHSARVNMVAWYFDGSRIASISDDNTVQVWDTSSKQILLIYTGHSDNVIVMAWSPDGSRIASAIADETCSMVQVWDALCGRHLLTYIGHSYPAHEVVWSPDGSRIASGDLNGDIQIWDAANGQLLLTYTGHSSQVNTLAWSPDGSRIASAAYDSNVQVWNTISGQLLLTYTGHSDSVHTVVWSPDGSRIASAANDIQIWYATDGWHLFTYTGSSQWVNGAAWSSDGSRPISSYMNIEQICSLITGYSKLAWSPDGLRIAVSAERTVQIWQVVRCSP